MFHPCIAFSIEGKNNENKNIDSDPFNDTFNKLNPYSDNVIHRQATNLNQCAKSFLSH